MGRGFGDYSGFTRPERLSLTQSQGNGRVPCNIKGIVETAHQMDAKLHKDNFLHSDIFKPRFRPFSFYLPINFINMAIVPLMQMFLIVITPIALVNRHVYFADTMEVLTYLGITFFL